MLRDVVSDRLDHLGVTAYRVSCQAGKKPSWLHNLGDNPRADTITLLADVIGLPVDVLLYGGDVTEYLPPRWLELGREVEEYEEATSPWPPCSECGRRKRPAAGGLCQACYQRGRRAAAKAALEMEDAAIEAEVEEMDALGLVSEE